MLHGSEQHGDAERRDERYRNGREGEDQSVLHRFPDVRIFGKFGEILEADELRAGDDASAQQAPVDHANHRDQQEDDKEQEHRGQKHPAGQFAPQPDPPAKLAMLREGQAAPGMT